MIRKSKHLLEYLGVRLVCGLFHLLPARFSFWVGEQLGRVFSVVLPRRKALVLDNLEKAFPEKNRSERERIAARVWRNLGRTAVEFIRMPDVTKEKGKDIFITEGVENFEEAKKRGNGVIFITSHFTNWEITGVGCQFLAKNVVAIARPMSNPYVEAWVQSKRKKSGMKIILHRQAVRASLKVLKKQAVIGILVDQNLYTGGIFVDFFGRPAATTTLPALLHLRTGAPIVMASTLRQKDRFRLIYDPPIYASDQGVSEERIREVTEKISHAVESMIRKHPENWFWIHNRWKRKPEGVS